MKKHTALKQNIKNDTCIDFRRDIKALTLLADTSSSGNLLKTFIHRKYTVDIDRIQICTKDKNRTIIRNINYIVGQHEQRKNFDEQ